MTARQATLTRQILLFVMIVAMALAFWQVDEIRAIFDEVVDILGRYIARHPASGAVGFIALAVISAMFSSISSVPIVPVAVAIWGPGLTALFLFIGWVGGDIAAYAIGSSAGHPMARHFISAARLKRWEDHFERGTTFLPAFLFKLTTPAETGYLFGLIKYPLIHYLAIIAIAEILLALLAVYASQALLERRVAVFGFLLLGAAIAAAGILAYFRLRRPAKFRRVVQAVIHPIKTLKK